MEVKQVYELVNNITGEILGDSALLKEDLSNIVDLGTAVFNANAMDKYVKKLVNHIGKMIFVNRAYTGGVPKVLMDSWEFGSVLEKVSVELPEAEENETWELVDRASYDPNIFYQPKVEAKFYNSKVTFEIPVSFTDIQVRQSFDNATQLNAFISMIYGAVEKAMTIKTEALIMRTINNMTAETIKAEYNGASISGGSHVKAVNLLYLYNQAHTGATLTASNCLESTEFLKFASYTIGLYMDRLTRMSTLFNVGGKERFTTKDLMHVVLLSEFANASATYLQADTYHKELVSLPNYEKVPYWQGTGTGYAFADTSKVYVKTASGTDVTITGLLGVIFDRDALGVCNTDRRVTTNYNPKAEFTNNWVKFDASYFNDLNENFVAFFVA